MARKSHLTTAQFAILNDACIPLVEAFDSMPYLVGSATERADYRDVDLRLILPDEEFDRLFSGRELLWSLLSLTIGQYLAGITGLPIDFQIQRMTEANEKFPGPGNRNPMGMANRPLAGGGDATNFNPSMNGDRHGSTDDARPDAGGDEEMARTIQGVPGLAHTLAPR